MTTCKQRTPLASVNKTVKEKLSRLDAKVSFSRNDRLKFSRDASLYSGTPIGVVSFPPGKRIEDREETLQKLVKYCVEDKVPLTFVGSRTSLAGQAINKGGLVVDMSNFKKIYLPNQKHPITVEVEPGVFLDELNTTLRKRTLADVHFVASQHTLDLSSSDMATIGGTIMNNGGGIMATKYGSARHNVVDLKVLMPDGTITWTSKIDAAGPHSKLYNSVKKLIEQVGPEKIIRTYPKVRKNSSGYNLLPLAETLRSGKALDMTQLFVGSEGTLGILLKAKVRLHRVRRAQATALLFFDSLSHAARAIKEIMAIRSEKHAIIPTAIEIVDGTIYEMIDELKVRLPRQCKPPANAKTVALLVEYNDADPITRTTLKQLKIIYGRHKPIELKLSDGFRVVRNRKERKYFWYLRKNIVRLVNEYAKKYHLVAPPIVEDIGVPLDKLHLLIQFLEDSVKRADFKAAIYGHAGDGNLHVRVLVRNTPQDMKKAWNIMDQVYRKVTQNWHGTISAEHGDGLLRTPYLSIQYPGLIHLFRNIKELFDPAFVLNPGVKVSDDVPTLSKSREWTLDGFKPTGGGTPKKANLA